MLTEKNIRNLQRRVSSERIQAFETRENALHDAMKRAIEIGEPQWIGNYIHFEKGSVRCYVVADPTEKRVGYVED